MALAPCLWLGLAQVVRRGGGGGNLNLGLRVPAGRNQEHDRQGPGRRGLRVWFWLPGSYSAWRLCLE